MKKYLAVGALVVSLVSSLSAMETMPSSGMKDDMMKGSVSATGTMMSKGKMMDDKMMQEKMVGMEMYDMINMNSPRADVTKLQMMLVEGGYLVMPKNVAYGYYGRMTKAAHKMYMNKKMMMKDAMMKATSSSVMPKSGM